MEHGAQQKAGTKHCELHGISNFFIQTAPEQSGVHGIWYLASHTTPSGTPNAN